MGPLVLFFLVNSYGDRWFGVATGEPPLPRHRHLRRGRPRLSLAITWTLVRKLPVMPLVSAVVITIFGGLTLLLHDELFIKLKPTIVNTLFGGVRVVWAGLTAATC